MTTLTKCRYSKTRAATANAKIAQATEMAKTATTYVRKAKPNSKIKKLRIRLIISKMQAKNFSPEFLSLHPNQGHGTPESTLGNSPSSRPVLHKIKLKETDRKNGRVSHNI